MFLVAVKININHIRKEISKLITFEGKSYNKIDELYVNIYPSFGKKVTIFTFRNMVTKVGVKGAVKYYRTKPEYKYCFNGIHYNTLEEAYSTLKSTFKKKIAFRTFQSKVMATGFITTIESLQKPEFSFKLKKFNTAQEAYNELRKIHKLRILSWSTFRNYIRRSSLDQAILHYLYYFKEFNYDGKTFNTKMDMYRYLKPSFNREVSYSTFCNMMKTKGLDYAVEYCRGTVGKYEFNNKQYRTLVDIYNALKDEFRINIILNTFKTYVSKFGFGPTMIFLTEKEKPFRINRFRVFPENRNQIQSDEFYNYYLAHGLDNTKKHFGL
jgi:hypothetical protein